MPKTAEAPDTDSKTILIVEDSTAQASHLQALLEKEGLRVALACDGEGGLQMAQQLHPDLILLDVQLPDMNGFHVCQRLKGACDTADIPVIMFTHHHDSDLARLGLQMGADDYIPKDAFSDAVLLETLRPMGLIVERET